MKPVLHFQMIDQLSSGRRLSKSYMKLLLKSLQERFSKDWDVIITPLTLQAENCVNITIGPDTDIQELIDKLDSLKNNTGNANKHYEFHRKYLPQSVYNILDYDGDESIHPLDAMNDWWMPVIEMVNHSHVNNKRVLEIMKERDMDPLTVINISDDDSSPSFIHIKCEAYETGGDYNNSFQSYMVRIINMLNYIPGISSEEIYSNMTAAGINPWLFVDIEYHDGGFPWTIIDENYIIKFRDEYHDITGLYVLAASIRKENIARREVI